MLPGLVDTNVFIHAQTHDALAEECLGFLEAVQRGEVEARRNPWFCTNFPMPFRTTVKV